jgi:hypothetical protein
MTFNPAQETEAHARLRTILDEMRAIAAEPANVVLLAEVNAAADAEAARWADTDGEVL